MALIIPAPDTGEYADFHNGYIAAVAGERDAIAVLERQRTLIEACRLLSAEQASHRYAPGKWSVRDIIGHVSDAERVVSYRLLSVARGERGMLPGFDEQLYAAHSNADRRALDDLVDELAVVRAATLALVKSLDETMLMRTGNVNNWTLTVRAIAFIIAGHFQHHVNVLAQRYGIDLAHGG
jgi:uncharacterized damage-inducible protein DinB